MSTSQSQMVLASPSAIDRRIPPMRHLPRRTLLVVAAVTILAAGMFLKWDWLVAAGIAPLILGLLPCAAMCALVTCADRIGGKADGTERTRHVGDVEHNGLWCCRKYRRNASAVRAIAEVILRIIASRTRGSQGPLCRE